jgi:hypothetical protein
MILLCMILKFIAETICDSISLYHPACSNEAPHLDTCHLILYPTLNSIEFCQAGVFPVRALL